MPPDRRKVCTIAGSVGDAGLHRGAGGRAGPGAGPGADYRSPVWRIGLTAASWISIVDTGSAGAGLIPIADIQWWGRIDLRYRATQLTAVVVALIKQIQLSSKVLPISSFV